MRARLAVFSAGVPCELREVVLRDKPTTMLEASPKGTVPVLILPDGQIIDQSLDIMLWALGRNDPDGWLKPESGSLEEMLQWITVNDEEFKANLDRYKYPNRYELASGEQHRDAAGQWLEQLDLRLKDTAWLFGHRPTLADMAILPFIRQFAHVDREWFKQQPWDEVQRWLGGFLDSPVLAGCMEKYVAWKPGAELVVFPVKKS